MKIKLVADSSANLNSMEGVDFSAVPLRILAGDREYVDTHELDVPGMLKDLKAYKGKSCTACPGVEDWISAFGDADIVYGAAITSNLSGCWNSASVAAKEYLERKPGAKVFILDSLSTGPEMELILEKYAELIREEKDFEAVCDEIKAYMKRTQLIFSLESLANFAKNGRISPTVAAAAGLLGIRVVGRASDEGTLEPMHKCRGEAKTISQLFATMKKLGFRGGKVRLSHSYNEGAAEKLAEMIRSEFPECDIRIRLNRGLCCYYAEVGGLLVGFEA